MKIIGNLITHALDDGLLVARPGGHRLFAMNASARFIWEQLANGAEDAEIPRLIAGHYGIDLQRAESDFRNTLDRWRQDGLIDRSESRRHYAIGGIGFSLEYGSSHIEEVVAPLIAHLQSPAGLAPQQDVDVGFSIYRENDGFMLRADGVHVETAASLDGMIERLLFDIVMHAYNKIDWLISTHAAAIGTDLDCILLPGASGVGKSTLTAFLLSQPHTRYLTDDMVLLDRESLCVIPMPSAVVLKRGSWDVLDPHLHQLASLTARRRYDADVKYWLPDPGQIAGDRLPVRAVVFPSRMDGSSKPVLTRLSAFEGLSRIIAAPAAIKSPITRETVECLTAWAHRIPFYTLAYGRLEDAGKSIGELLAP